MVGRLESAFETGLDYRSLENHFLAGDVKGFKPQTVDSSVTLPCFEWTKLAQRVCAIHVYTGSNATGMRLSGGALGRTLNCGSVTERYHCLSAPS